MRKTDDRPLPTPRQRAQTNWDEFHAQQADVEEKRAAAAAEREVEDSRWAMIRAEAAALEPGKHPLFQLLMWQDEKLVAARYPRMGRWWRWSLGDPDLGFYASGKRWAIFEVGRGGAKSTMATRVSACENTWGEHDIPPGQDWIWPFISIGKPDARRRLTEIKAILLHAYGTSVEIAFPDGVPTIAWTDYRGQPALFVSLASSIAAVSGPNARGMTMDELAKFKDAEGANPATEILASAVGMFRARPGIHGFQLSSAWMRTGCHFSAVHEGDTATNWVARIGAPFLQLALEGFEAVARWEESREDHAAAAQVRAYARTVTAETRSIPTWVANETIGAVASRIEIDALPSDQLKGLSRITVWLREIASVAVGGEAGGQETLSEVDFQRSAPVTREALADVVLAVAPAVDGSEWGILVVGVTDHGPEGRAVVLADESGALTGGCAAAVICRLAVEWSASFAIVATPHARRVQGELDAHVRGCAVYAPPVVEVSSHDGGALRVGPLRTLYRWGRVAHVAGLGALERIAHGWTPDGGRSPRVEALVAGSTHLQLGAWATAGESWTEPLRAPRLADTLGAPHTGEQSSIVNRLGGYAARGDM